MANTSESKRQRIVGTTPISSEALLECWGWFLRILVRRFDISVGYTPQDFAEPDHPAYAALHCLCIVLREHPPTNTGQLEDIRSRSKWNAALYDHVTRYQEKIPDEFRSDFVHSVQADIEFINQVVGKLTNERLSRAIRSHKTKDK